MKKNKSIFSITKQKSIYLTLFALSVIGCGGKENTEKPQKVIPVKVLNVEFFNEHIQRNYVGTAEGSSAISVSFSGMGNVERVYVSEGQRINKGQLLAELNSVTVQNAYEVAKSTLKQAEDAYARMSELHKKGSLPDIKFIEVETGLEQAKAMEAIARKSLDDCKLYAPMSGIIAERSVEEGQNAMPGLSAFKIVSIDDVNINVAIPENEIGTVRVGQPAKVQVTALQEKAYEGRVDIKGIEANPISHTYKITVKLRNPQSEIIPGMVCKVYLSPLEEDGNKKIIIPNKSVRISPDGQRFVWLAEDNVAKRRFITTGSLADYGVIVEEGLKEGEQVIIEGSNKVSEGMQVSIVK